MRARLVAIRLLAAAATVFYVGLALYAGRGPGRGRLSPFAPMPTTGTILMVFAGAVLLPAAGVAALVAWRGRRLAQRLGIAPPSGGRPDEDLGAGRIRDEPR